MTAEAATTSAPSMTRDGTRLIFVGRLDAAAAADLWRKAEVAKEAHGALELDLAGVETLDTNGAALLIHAGGTDPRTTGASPAVAAVLARAVAAAGTPGPAATAGTGFAPLTSIGAAAFDFGREVGSGLAFVGEAAVTIASYLMRPRGVRLGDLLRHLDEAGTRAFGLCVLLGSLLGLILAFQFSVPMRQFGAEIFIPRLVGIALLRELGPLMAGIILSGRTGSAYAAEIGTMTVNEEVDALRIMGINPMRMLVLPRLLTGMLVMPVLSLLFTLAGLVGMGAVMTGLGYPPSATINQLSGSLTLGDMVGGLGKAATFGFAIAGIGCRAGLTAGRGPQAVGDAATSAVVGGIVAIVMLDGIFAILFFRLGW